MNRGHIQQREEVEVTLETLDPAEDGYAPSYFDVTDASSVALPTSVALNTGRDWEDSDKRRCQEPVVQLSVPSSPKVRP